MMSGHQVTATAAFTERTSTEERCLGTCRCITYYHIYIFEGSLEVKLPTIWTDEKQSREEAERRERLEERRSEEKE